MDLLNIRLLKTIAICYQANNFTTSILLESNESLDHGNHFNYIINRTEMELAIWSGKFKNN